MANSPPGDGNSVAAWTGTLILLLGAGLIGAGIMWELGWATWVGVAAVVLGVLAWVVLHRAGYGESKPGSH